jgi:hypothetical protein
VLFARKIFTEKGQKFLSICFYIQVARLLNNGSFGEDEFNFVYNLGLREHNRLAVEISTFTEVNAINDTAKTVVILYFYICINIFTNPIPFQWSKGTSAEHTPYSARFLVYGCKNWVGKQLIELLEASQIEHAAGICQPGVDVPEKVRQEIVEESPSHVILVLSQQGLFLS